MTRDDQIKVALLAIERVLRKQFHLTAQELQLDWHHEQPSYDVHIEVLAQGPGEVATRSPAFKQALTAERKKYVTVLDFEQWVANKPVQALGDVELAVRLRSKVK